MRTVILLLALVGCTGENPTDPCYDIEIIIVMEPTDTVLAADTIRYNDCP